MLGGFRRGRGCTDQIFTFRQICEKYLGKGKDVNFAFLDLEKAYDRVDRNAMWNVLRLYGIGGRLLRGVKSFYVGSKACVRVGNEVSEVVSSESGAETGMCDVTVAVQSVYGWSGKRGKCSSAW